MMNIISNRKIPCIFLILVNGLITHRLYSGLFSGPWCVFYAKHNDTVCSLILNMPPVCQRYLLWPLGLICIYQSLIFSQITFEIFCEWHITWNMSFELSIEFEFIREIKDWSLHNFFANLISIHCFTALVISNDNVIYKQEMLKGNATEEKVVKVRCICIFFHIGYFILFGNKRIYLCLAEIWWPQSRHKRLMVIPSKSPPQQTSNKHIPCSTLWKQHQRQKASVTLI